MIHTTDENDKEFFHPRHWHECPQCGHSWSCKNLCEGASNWQDRLRTLCKVCRRAQVTTEAA